MVTLQWQQQAWLCVRLWRQAAEPGCSAASAALTAGPSFLGEETETTLTPKLKTLLKVLIEPCQGIFHSSFSAVGNYVFCLCPVLTLSPSAYPEGRAGGRKSGKDLGCAENNLSGTYAFPAT